MAANQRLANGTVSASTINADSSALVTDFTRQSDQGGMEDWGMQAVGHIKTGDYITTLNGYSQPHGFYNGVIEWRCLTQGMMDYLWTNVMGSSYSAAVTIKLFHHLLGWSVFNCILHWKGVEEQFERQRQDAASNIQMTWDRGSIASA